MRIVLVPGVPALLPEYRSLEDPVAALRAACLEAVAWLGQGPRIVAGPQGVRVAETLLAGVADGGLADGGLERLAGARSSTGEEGREPGVLVVGNGSARRTEASPGPFDARAGSFDDALGRALRAPDPAALRALDGGLAEELWADTGSFAALADLLDGARLVGVDYDDAPHGVQYWVMRWQA
jgi:hypothetical protein